MHQKTTNRTNGRASPRRQRRFRPASLCHSRGGRGKHAQGGSARNRVRIRCASWGWPFPPKKKRCWIGVWDLHELGIRCLDFGDFYLRTLRWTSRQHAGCPPTSLEARKNMARISKELWPKQRRSQQVPLRSCYLPFMREHETAHMDWPAFACEPRANPA